MIFKRSERNLTREMKMARRDRLATGPGLFLVTLCCLALLAACDQFTNPGPMDCDEGGTLFNDDFSDGRNCGWALYNDSGVIAVIEGEELHLRTGQPGQILWTNPGRVFDNAIITVLARQVAGSDDNAYGVICRYQNEQNFYVFLVSGDGFYAIAKYQSGSDQVIYLTGDGQFTFSEVINQGQATNEIRAACVGEELSLTVNGFPLVTVVDSSFPEGDIGVAASTFQPGTADIAFDDIRVIAP